MKTHAKAKYLKISPRKLRLSADAVRGARVGEAERRLAAMPQKGAELVAEALKSAVANAENNHNARKSTLSIAEIKVDQGPKLKRWRPRSRGMAAPILHPMAHLTLVVTDEVVEPVKPATKAAKATDKKPVEKKETK